MEGEQEKKEYPILQPPLRVANKLVDWRARKRALAAGKRIVADKFAHPRISSGRGGGLGTLGNGSKRFRRSKPQGSAHVGPTHSRVTSCTVLEQLNGSYRSAILKARLLQCAFDAGVGLPLLR